MADEAEPQLRAWVEYYRDLGIHDFYRRGEPAHLPATEAPGTVAIAAPIDSYEAAEAGRHTLASRPAARSISSEERDAPAAAAHGPPHFFSASAEPRIAQTIPVPLPLKLVSFNDLAPLPTEPIPDADRAAALRAIQEDIGDCTRCPLAYAGRRRIVFGDGSPAARLMFVGEGPGADEDAQGVPFVGKAGQLLNNMIAAMGLARADVYIANIVKCRPPNNRVPEPVEANTCSQFLLRQIDVVQPEVIVALGATAAMYLLGVKQSLSSLRGRWHRCRGAKLAVTYHPAFLLRDPRQKAEAWKDLQMVMSQLGLTPPARK